MRRFFRSAAFPILIVIVLAFFAQRLITPGQPEATPTFSEFFQQVKQRPDTIQSVTFQQKTDTIDVTESDNNTFSTGYPADFQSTLVSTLAKKGVETKVEG